MLTVVEQLADTANVFPDIKRVRKDTPSPRETARSNSRHRVEGGTVWKSGPGGSRRHDASADVLRKKLWGHQVSVDGLPWGGSTNKQLALDSPDSHVVKFACYARRLRLSLNRHGVSASSHEETIARTRPQSSGSFDQPFRTIAVITATNQDTSRQCVVSICPAWPFAFCC